MLKKRNDSHRLSDNEEWDSPSVPESSCTSASVDTPKAKRMLIVKDEEDTVPLPDPFPLPKHYGNEVDVALKSKQMTTSVRKAFIQKVAASMLCYKRYPTSTDYVSVGRSVVSAYPFLKSPAGSPAVSINSKFYSCQYNLIY